MKKLVYVLTLAYFAFSIGLLAKEIESVKSEKQNISCEMISNQDAINKAEKMSGGKVVSIKLDKKSSSPTYKVRVIVDDKRVKNLSIKACKK